MRCGTVHSLIAWMGLVIFSGCWSNPSERLVAPPKTAPTQADLIAFHKQRAAQIDSLISTYSQSWEGLEKTGTGIHLEWLERMSNARSIGSLPKGTVLELHHRFSLLDERTITTWRDDGPLAFECGSTDLPSGFHEIIGAASLGDSVRALIPPSRAWGMTGLPPEIPQEAIIYVEMRIDLYTPPE